MGLSGIVEIVRMRERSLLILAGCALFLSIQVGCGPAQEEITDQTTPRAVLQKLHKAVMNEDRKAFLQCFDGPREAISAGYELSVAGWRFREAVIERFGQPGWDELNDGSGTERHFAIRAWPRQDGWWNEIEFEEETSSRAVFDCSWTRLVETMVRDGSTWRWKNNTPAEKATAVATLLSRWTRAVRTAHEKLDERDVTIPELKALLAAKAFGDQ
jgi:hypothetical protein